MTEDERREAQRKYHDRITLRMMIERSPFLRTSLSPRDAYRSVANFLQRGEHGDCCGGPAFAYVTYHQPDETLELTLAGIGGPRDEFVARIWGVEEQSPSRSIGRFLCDVHTRLWMNAAHDFHVPSMPAGTRLAQWTDVIDDHAPFPGVLLGYPSGFEGGSPTLLLPDAWEMKGFIIEMALLNHAGGTAASGASGLWRSFHRPRPRPIPPELLDPSSFLEQLGGGHEGPADGDAGEDWKKGPDEDPSDGNPPR